MPVVVKKKKYDVVKQKSPKFEPKQIWKPKVDFSKGNIQNDSRFYEEYFKRTNLSGKEKDTFVDEKRKIDLTEKVEVKNEKKIEKRKKIFPKLNESYCVKIPKVKHAWVALFK
ncbi:hypothetical protein Hanom_Chr07g00626841 [Helianthus anomalus]